MDVTVLRSAVVLMVATLFACDGVENGSSQLPADASTNASGGRIFDAQRALCHGRDGRLGMSGAKDLAVSKLDRAQVAAVVTNGRGAMMAYGRILTPEELDAVVDHVLTLRRSP